jgi:hypothetical protein
VRGDLVRPIGHVSANAIAPSGGIFAQSHLTLPVTAHAPPSVALACRPRLQSAPPRAGRSLPLHAG